MSDERLPEDDLQIEELPDDYFDHEGDGEMQDPRLTLESRSGDMRTAWNDWFCKAGESKFVNVKFYGRNLPVPAPAVDAYRALEAALKVTGYQSRKAGTYKCRHINNDESRPWSLHSYGIAVDIDADVNKYTAGDPYAGWIKKHHFDAVMKIMNTSGKPVWHWGGEWDPPDRMHFQLDQGPTAVAIDWNTVPGGGEAGSATTSFESNVLGKGAEGKAVEIFQQRLLAWDASALPKYGADGDYGSEAAEWVTRFQAAHGLPETGQIDGITANLLMQQ